MDPIGNLITQAHEDINNEEYLEVITNLRGAVRTYPDEAELQYLIAVSYEKLDRQKRAMKHAMQAFEIDSQYEPLLILLGKLYLNNNQINQAEEILLEALIHNSGNMDAKILLAEIELIKNDYKKAHSYIEEVLLINPNHFKAYRLKTKLYIKTKQSLDKILQLIDQSKKISDELEIEYDIANAYYVHGHFDKCKEIYKEMSQKHPNSTVTQEISVIIQNIQAEATGSFGEKKNKQQTTQPSPTEDSADISLEDALAQLNNLIGLGEIKGVINRIVKLVQYNKKRSEMLALKETVKQSYHFAFLGNPGTGKTTVARILGDIFYSLGLIEKNVVVEVDRSDLVGEFIGHTAPKTKEVVESALGGVLFIDEAYALAPGDSGSNDFGAEAIDALIKEMEDQRDNLIVVFAGYNEEMKRLFKLNPGLSSRVNFHLDFADYTDTELLAIAHKIAEDNLYTLTPDAKEAFLIKINQEKTDSNFSNGRAVRNIIEAAIRERAYRLSDQHVSKEDLLILEPSDFGVDPDQIFGEDLDEVLAELHSLEGLTAIKDQVTSLSNYVNIEKKRKEKISSIELPNLHMIFTGNPGTGKTTIARLLSRILKSLGVLKRGHLIEVTRDDLVGQFIGQTGPKTKDKIKEAYGGVLFIDEAYSLHSESKSDFGSEAIATLITEMENNRDKLVVIMAGYSEEMEGLLTVNQGIESRVGYFFDFPDYNEEELTNIFHSIVESNGFTMTADATDTLKELFTYHVMNKDNHFGNARLARNIFEKTKLNQSNRLSTNLEGDLFTLTSEDIPEPK